MGITPVLPRTLMADADSRRRLRYVLARQKCQVEGCMGLRELTARGRERSVCVTCRKRKAGWAPGSSRPELAKWTSIDRGVCPTPGCGRLCEVDVRKNGSVRVRPVCHTCRKTGQRLGARQEPRPLGSSRVSRDGYVTVKTERGWDREHRVVMEGMLGRELTESESVHHVNGVRSDNRPENLELRVRFHGAGQAWGCLDCGSSNVLPVSLSKEV